MSRLPTESLTTGEAMLRAGRTLRHFRTVRGQSLRNVAEHTGISPSALSQFENGTCMPTVDTAAKIMSCLNLDFTERRRLVEFWSLRAKRDYDAWWDVRSTFRGA